MSTINNCKHSQTLLQTFTSTIANFHKHFLQILGCTIENVNTYYN